LSEGFPEMVVLRTGAALSGIKTFTSEKTLTGARTLTLHTEWFICAPI
jgi:hypothetical protein